MYFLHKKSLQNITGFRAVILYEYTLQVRSSIFLCVSAHTRNVYFSNFSPCPPAKPWGVVRWGWHLIYSTFAVNLIWVLNNPLHKAHLHWKMCRWMKIN